MKTSILTKALWALQNFNAKTNQSGVVDFATVISCNIVEDESIEQIGTDGETITLNPVWWNSLDLNSQVFALSHEAAHIQNLHCERMAEKDDHERWNIAIDIWVNAVKLNDGHKPRRDIYITGDTYGINIPLRYSCDQIYNMLAGKTGNKQSSSGSGGSGSMSTGNDVKQKRVPQEVAAEKLARIRQVAISCGMDTTKIPNAFEDAYKEATAPRKDWREECFRFVARIRESHWSMQRPMAAYRARRIIMPNIKRHNKVDFAFVIDTSGSIRDEEYGLFVATVREAFEQLRPERMIGILADNIVRAEHEFDRMPDKIPFRGRGGTDFRPALTLIGEKYPEIGGVIYLTDGYGDYPAEATAFPMLWAINNHEMNPPFGDVCRI